MFCKSICQICLTLIWLEGLLPKECSRPNEALLVAFRPPTEQEVTSNSVDIFSRFRKRKSSPSDDGRKYELCEVGRSSAEPEHQSWHECEPKPHSVLSLAKCLCLDHLHPGKPEGCHGDRKTGEDENQPNNHLGLFCQHFHDVCLCFWPVTLASYGSWCPLCDLLIIWGKTF